MTVNTFFTTWKWPNRVEDTPISAFDIPAGITNVDVPSALLENFRNFGFEFLFTGVTAADQAMTISFFRANDVRAYAVANIEELATARVTLDSTNTNSTSAVFLRDIKNIDNKFMRMVINAPAGVTANLVINVKVGENAR